MVSVTVTAERFAEYFAEEDPARVRRWEEEMRELAALGWIALDPGKGAEAHRVARIRRNAPAADEIGNALGRMGAEAFGGRWRELIEARLEDAERGAIAREARERWVSYLRSELERSGAMPPDAALRPAWLEERSLIYSAVDGLIRYRLGAPRMSWRQFATTRFGDSKILNPHRARICRILAEILSADVSLDADDDSLLSHFGIDAKEGLIQLQGPLRVRDPRSGWRLEASEWHPFAAVPESMLLRDGLEWDLSGMRLVLTIENEESFQAWAREALRDDCLAIYTGGFPSRARIALLRHLAGSGAVFCHWGDLDCGGIEIFRFLEREVGVPIEPVGMEPSRLGEHRSSCQAMTPAERARMRRIAGAMGTGHPLHPLALACLEEGLKLEQEALTIADLRPERIGAASRMSHSVPN
jgi:hypothetical protein